MTTTTQAPHTAATRPLELGAAAVVVFLCLCWGFNQVAVKLALTDIPPLTQAAIRSTGAALIIWIYARSRGISLDLGGETLKPGLVAGVLFGLEFIFIYPALLYTTASRATLFIYVAPFVVVLGSHFLVPTDRFRWTQWAGLLMSFAGLVLAFGVPTPSADANQMLGDLLALAGGIAWGFTTLVVKSSSLARAAPEKTLQYQLVISAPMLAVAAWVLGETHHPDAGRRRPDLAGLPDRVGGLPHLPDLVHHGVEILGQPSFGLHISDAIIRRVCGLSGDGRPDHAGVRRRGGAGDRRPVPGEPAALRVPLPGEAHIPRFPATIGWIKAYSRFHD